MIEVFKKPEVDFILLEIESSSEQEINLLRIPEFAMEDDTNKKEYEGYTIACREA
ncbi:MAG: hypothetical protein SGI89_15190 [bacterium]|nr:hypothetical protein [bacterium]